MQIRFYRDTSVPNQTIERYWRKTTASTSWGSPFAQDVFPAETYSPLVTLRSSIQNFAETFRRDPRYFQLPGTMKAEFEFGVEGQPPSQGGVGSSPGLIGANGGFDLRSLAIVDANVDKIRFNTMSEEATFQATVITLPFDSAIFSAPWVPSGDISWGITVGGLGFSGPGGVSNQKIYQEFTGTVAMTNGVATFQATWDGKYYISEPVGDEVVGVAYASFNANAPSPSSDTIYAREEYATVECYVCPSDVPGSVDHCINAGGQKMMYQSHISGLGSSSLGHGWQEVSNNRLVGSIGNKVIFYAQGGAQMSWNLVAGKYKPSTRNSYTICEKDNVTPTDFAAESRTPRFTLTFKNQAKMLFNDSGRLIRTLDRNDNADDYFYDAQTGHLERIESDGGLNTYFQRRPDGQPTEIREGDPVTGRLTTLEYYTEEQSELGPLGRLHKVTNPMGEVTEYRYNELKKLYKIIDPRGEVAVEYFYDLAGRKVKEVLYSDLVRTYDYTFFGVEMREEDLSPFGPQASSPDPEIPSGSGLFTSTNFDDRQRLDSMSVGYWSYYAVYDSIYNEVTEEFEDVVVGYEIAQQEEVTLMTLEYTDEDNPFLKTKLIDPDFKTMEWKYDEFGNVIEEKDKDDNLTTFTYADSLDEPLNPKHRNLLRLIQRPAVEVREVLTTYEPTELIYDEFGNLEEVIDVRDADSFKQTMTYTPDGLVETITDRRGHTTVFEYSGTPFTKNQKRNLLRIKTPKGENPGDGFRTVHFTYDAYNNVETIQDDLGNTVEYTFDLLDRMTHMVDARDETTVYVYEDALLKEIFSPPNAASNDTPRKTTFLRDFKGRTTEVFRQFGLSQISRVTFEYDARSQLRTLNRKRNGMSSYYTFDYDRRGRMKNMYDPFFKGSFIFHPQFCKNTQTVSARGVRKLFRNNERCLLAEIFDISDGTEIKERSFKYDSLKRLVRSNYYHNGKYTDSVFGLDTYQGFQHTDSVYDKRNRLVEKTFSDGAYVAFSYDPEGNLESLTGTDQQATWYTYYRDGLLNEVRVETDGLPDKVFKHHYDLAGRLERLDYPGESGLILYLSDANSTTPGSGYDANGNLLHMRYELNGVPVRSFHYTYDKSGNRETLEIITPSKSSLYQFGYDWLDRLTTVSLGINGASPALIRVYEFDEADNRRFFDDYTQGLNGVTYYYTYKGHGAYSSDQVEAIYIYPGAAGHRTAEDFFQLHEALEYDDDGNLTKRTKSNGEIISLDWTTYDFSGPHRLDSKTAVYN